MIDHSWFHEVYLFLGEQNVDQTQICIIGPYLSQCIMYIVSTPGGGLNIVSNPSGGLNIVSNPSGGLNIVSNPSGGLNSV